jgi:hypothetical protein
MSYDQKRAVADIPDFDVLHEDPEKCAEQVLQKLKEGGFTKTKIVEYAAIGEVVPIHYEIRVGNDTVAFVYKPIACHNYNEISIGGKKIRVATIDTMLSFYLAFLYTDHDYFSQYKERLLCMAQFLFDVEQKNRLSQKGLLKRFSISCYGVQPTLESIRSEKAEMFTKLKDNRSGPEFEEWFLKYNPGDKSAKKKGKAKSFSRDRDKDKDNIRKERSATRRSSNYYSKTKKMKTATTARKTFGEYLF